MKGGPVTGVEVFVTSIPFAAASTHAVEVLAEAGVVPVVNPLGRKPTADELPELLAGAKVVLAGTESYTAEVLDRLPDLQLIARMGVGLDGVDLAAAGERGVAVTYTPEAPAPAVADLTIGMMIGLLRGIHLSHVAMTEGRWHRVVGRRLGEVRVGLLGTGSIGREVARLLDGLGVSEIFVHDLVETPLLADELRNAELTWVDRDTLFREVDVVSIHLPLTSETRVSIGEKELRSMKPDGILVNTARGGIVDEEALHRVLESGHLGGVGVDVFEHEPYDGPLRTVDRCLMTAHIASSTVDCRTRMEVEAAREAVRMLGGEPLACPVPGHRVSGAEVDGPGGRG